MSYQLREYQKEAVAAGIEHMERAKGGGIIVMPTGSGKSLIIASIATALPGHTLVFQPTREILAQNLEKTLAFGFEDVGVFSASAGRKDFGKITFATIGSVKNRRDSFAHFENIIVDECHAVNAKGGMYKDFIEWSGGRLLGLTATPYRLHSFNDVRTNQRAVVAKFLHRTRPRMFEKVICVVQVPKLVTGGFLCATEHHEATGYIHSQITLNSTGMDFDQDALRTYNEERGLTGQVARAVMAHSARHTLVFCVFVEEAREVSARLRELGISAATVSAETPKAEREQLIADFKSGKVRVVTNVGVLTTGFDFPELDCVVLARPTQSVGLYYQMSGRCVRVAPGKTSAKIVDLCGNTARFGKIGEFEIVEPTSGLHRLKSGKGFLTGVDFVSGLDLEEREYKGFKEGSGVPTSVLQFGKHKGRHITKVPNDYLVWCIQNFHKGRWKEAFEAEARRRGLPASRSEPIEALPF